MSRTAVISINASWNVINFRRGLIEALRANGWRVVALAPTDEYSPRFAALGVEHVPIAIDSLGLSPVRDLGLLLRYHRILRRIRPDVFLGYTAKPNVYGSLAAQALGIRVINNISGLGTAFIGGGLLRRIVSSLYRIALRRSAHRLLPESGGPRPLPRPQAGAARSGAPSARLGDRPGPVQAGASGPHRPTEPSPFCWPDGSSGRRVCANSSKPPGSFAAKDPNARFQLLGFLDAPNRSAIGRDEVAAWQAEGVIEYLGETDDVRSALAAADCVVLPSYREGLPRTLLEAAAMARPLIATDVPGCRQVVEHGVNGLLCAVGDAGSLADAMLEMLRVGPVKRSQMGTAGRARVERDYDEIRVVEAYLEAVKAQD